MFPALSVYVIVVDPKETCVTRPVGLIVATAGFKENQGVVAVTGAGGTEANNCVVFGPGKHILKLPVITGGSKRFVSVVPLLISLLSFLVLSNFCD